MNLREYYSHLDYTTPIGVLILVVVIFLLLKRVRILGVQCDNLNKGNSDMINTIDKMIVANNEKFKGSWVLDLSTVHAGIIKATMDNNKHFNDGIKSLNDRFDKLNADFASFSHYQQGNVALIGGDFKGAYSNYILSVKHSIISENLQNVSSLHYS